MKKNIWGICEKEGLVHVVPCDQDGYIIGGHIADEICLCEPRIEGPLVIHNEH